MGRVRTLHSRPPPGGHTTALGVHPLDHTHPHAHNHCGHRAVRTGRRRMRDRRPDRSSVLALLRPPGRGRRTTRPGQCSRTPVGLARHPRRVHRLRRAPDAPRQPAPSDRRVGDRPDRHRLAGFHRPQCGRRDRHTGRHPGPAPGLCDRCSPPNGRPPGLRRPDAPDPPARGRTRHPTPLAGTLPPHGGLHPAPARRRTRVRTAARTRRGRVSGPRWYRRRDRLGSGIRRGSQQTRRTDLTDDTHAQAHITALGELLEATAQKAPTHPLAELQAASKAFARAQRSQIRAEDRAAHAIRHAARDIVHTATGPDGSALAALLAALLWAGIIAGRWHEAKGHAHQADAARKALHHLQAAAEQALTPTLVALELRQPREDPRRTLAHDVRAAVPEQADRILTDPSWPALAALLADAEARGHQPHQLLKEAAAQRELATARQPARVLITRLQHTSRNPSPNPRAEAARRRTTASWTSQPGHGTQPPTAPATPPNRPRR